MANVTAILTSCKRPGNIPKILCALREQTEPAEIRLLNFGAAGGFNSDVFFRWDTGPITRWILAPMAKTPWIYLQDDDLMPGDAAFIADMLALAKQRPNFITGIKGREFSFSPPHYKGQPDVVDGPAAIVKTHAVMFRRDALKGCALPWTTIDGDIFYSLEIGRGAPVHHISRALSDRVERLDDTDAISRRPGHWQRRERMCREWLKHNGLG